VRYEIVLAPEALSDLHHVKAHLRAAARDAIEHLRHEPTKTSKSRIPASPRPAAGTDVTRRRVEILAIVPKSDALGWLERAGEGE
jgi:hypothetical protein